MKPLSVDGQPTEGGSVQIPLTFLIPPDQPPPRPKPPRSGLETPSPATLELSGRLALWLLPIIRSELAADISLEELDQASMPGVDATTHAAARAALHAAYEEGVKNVTSDLGPALARTFELKELEAIAAFAEKPSGRFSPRWRDAIHDLVASMAARQSAAVTAKAREAFCQDRSCAMAAAPGASAP